MSTLWDKIQAFFSTVEDFCLPFIKQFCTAAGPLVLAAAEQAVLALATQSMPGAAKQAAAFEQIKAKLLADGITVATSTINAAIEAACAKIKAEAPPA